MTHSDKQPDVASFFDSVTHTITHVVSDPGSRRAVVIDPVWDYDPATGETAYTALDAVLEHIASSGLSVDWILETHAHADHLSSAQHLKSVFDAPVAIGAHIVEVQSIFQAVFNLSGEFTPDGSQFDRLLNEGDVISVGDLSIEVMHTPGHTPACVTYLCGECAFVGDTLFMPDYGTARADFPGADPGDLYRSIQRILELPARTKLYHCHDYLPGTGRRNYEFVSTVAAQTRNIHLLDSSETAFVAMRRERDQGLKAPALLLPSVQVNIRAGQLPPPESNGRSFLKIPVRSRES